jgi:5-methyltetrahydrofolate--homocysteine methyltransferase
MTDSVICLDVDGTLVDHRGRIHPRDVEILTVERRATILLATGRLLPSLRRTLERNNLFADGPIPLPLVLQNGAALYRPDETLYARYPFPEGTQAALIDAMQAHPQVAYLLFSLSEVYVLWPTPLARGLIKRFALDARSFTEASRERAFTKAMCIAESEQLLEPFVADVAELSLEASYSIPTVFEMTRAGVDKGRGLATLLPALSLSDARIVAVGDGGNDLPLFDAADLALAPSTSPLHIRDRADGVIDADACGLLAPVLEAAGLAAAASRGRSSDGSLTRGGNTVPTDNLSRAVIDGDVPTAADETQRAIDTGLPPHVILNRGLIAAMEEVGRLYEEETYFLPEMLAAAQAMKAGLARLRPLLAESGLEPIGRVALGTVQGDVHDIGKNLVGIMLEGAGFEIVDLGADVPPQRFLEIAPIVDVIGLSALLTTTMPAMGDVLKLLEEAGLRRDVRVIVGGAPVTQSFADRIGADGYSPDASSAVRKIKALLGLA